MKFNFSRLLPAFEADFGRLNSSQKSGLEFLVDKINSDTFDTVSQVAYVLATVYWETARTFQPVSEKRANPKAQPKLYEQQSRYWNTGFYGRGYVQLTWKTNYKLFSPLVGRDLVSFPNAAKEPEVAYKILSSGIKRGLFTGKKLADFVNETKTDYLKARTVINGHDMAQAIAHIATRIEKDLFSSLVDAVPAETEKPAEIKPAENGLLDKVSPISIDSIKAAAGPVRNLLMKLGPAILAAGWIKLSAYLIAAIVLVIIVSHYWKPILVILKKLASKVTLS